MSGTVDITASPYLVSRMCWFLHWQSCIECDREAKRSFVKSFLLYGCVLPADFKMTVLICSSKELSEFSPEALLGRLFHLKVHRMIYLKNHPRCRPWSRPESQPNDPWQLATFESSG